MMTDTLQFGQPKAWAYPTVGMLQATGTPLPERIRVLISGRANQRIDIDETIGFDDEETRNQIIQAALIQAGDHDIEDFVETFVVLADGRAHVVGYVLKECHIREHIDAWSDDDDEDLLDAYIVDHGMEYADYDLSLQRMP